ncbi:hypothetical protein [Methylomonas koyamae]|uniref:hypothetical protein n=1 Tax=Methylomonas koyamae TaxID=702114 RepID=UPI001C7EA003|nr:hypothetical protein [Methylomonas koyamae]
MTLVKPALKVTEQVNCELTHDLAKSPDLFYLLEGLALQGQAYDEDRQLVVPKLPGSVIGLEYLLTECNQPATRVTLAAPAKVGVINKAALRRLIDGAPPDRQIELHRVIAQMVSHNSTQFKKVGTLVRLPF